MKRVNNLPRCTHCGSEVSKVHGTYYAERGEIVRQRKCSDCKKMFYTIQDFEVPMADNIKVHFPSRNAPDYREKKVKIVVT